MASSRGYSRDIFGFISELQIFFENLALFLGKGQDIFAISKVSLYQLPSGHYSIKLVLFRKSILVGKVVLFALKTSAVAAT